MPTCSESGSTAPPDISARSPARSDGFGFELTE
jgi:hypothetical protein